LYGDILQVAKYSFIVPSDGDWFDFIPWKKNNVFHMPHSQYVVNTDTIGQYTGLKDKNGKEIYEGDIIGCHNPNIKHLIFYNEEQGRFMAALGGDIENDYFGICGLDCSRWNATKEVIGNIHDNPELLTEELEI
jgi:uncharacterized phage protein (TIGR01671 family)